MCVRALYIYIYIYIYIVCVRALRNGVVDMYASLLRRRALGLTQWVGIACVAIRTAGLKDSIGNGEDLDAGMISELLLITQYFDTLEKVYYNNTFVFCVTPEKVCGAFVVT